MLPAKAVAALAVVAVLFVPAIADGANQGCGDEITVNTTLKSDLRGCQSDGLIVSGDVTLDLNGHAIAGRGAGAGIRIDGGSTVVVKNGTVRGFDIGVAKFATVDLEIENVTVVSNGTGISAFDVGGQLSVRNADVRRNASAGIALLNTDSATVEGNKIAANGNWGIRVDHAEPILIAHNVITRNGGGISVVDGTTRITANVVSHNDGDGIVVVDRTFLFFPYLIADNVANDNGGFGISFTGVTVGPNGETVDGGGNSARRNGAATQCVSIVCA